MSEHDPKNGGGGEQPSPLKSLQLAFLIAVGWLVATMVTLVALAAIQAPLLGAGVAALAGLAAAYVVDQKVAPDAPPLSTRLPTVQILVLSIIAALGFLILASEVDNVLESMSTAPPPIPMTPEGGLEVSPWEATFVVALSLVTISWVFNGLIARHLLTRFERWTVVPMLGFWAGIMAEGLGHPLILVAPLFAFGAWLFACTGSATVAALSTLPMPLLLSLMALGLAPNLPGFDVPSVDQVVYQPVWFDLLGAICVAVGVGGLLRVFSPPASASPE
ncbi:MAG: hypothetical protein ACE366_27970 [Bradymonadia bacterium]